MALTKIASKISTIANDQHVKVTESHGKQNDLFLLCASVINCRVCEL